MVSISRVTFPHNDGIYIASMERICKPLVGKPITHTTSGKTGVIERVYMDDGHVYIRSRYPD